MNNASLSKVIATSLVLKANLKARKQLVDFGVEIGNTFVSDVKPETMMESYVETIKALIDYRENLSHVNARLVRLNIEPTDYLISDNLALVINASLVYFSKDSNVFSSPLFKTSVEFDENKIFTPIQFNEFQTQLNKLDNNLFTKVSAYEVKNYTLHDLQSIYIGDSDKTIVVESDAIVPEEVVVLNGISMKGLSSGLSSVVEQPSLMEVSKWLDL